MKYKKWIDKNCQDLTGKTVVITGATGGIGEQAVKHFLYLNATVIMAVRNIDKANKFITTIESSNKPIVLKALKDCGRIDLIGSGPDCLINSTNNNIKTVPNTDRIKVKDVPQKMNKDNNNTNTNDISKIQIFNNTNNTTNYSNEISLLRKEIKEMKKAQSNNTVVDISKNMKDIESVKKIIPMFDQDITKIKKDVLAHEKNFNVIQYNFDNMKKLYDKVLIEFPKIEEIIMIYSKKNTNTEEKIKEIVDHLEQWEKQIVINFNTAFKQYKEVIEQTIKKQNQISPSIEQIEKSTYIENIPQGYSFNNVLAYTNGGEPFSISDNPYIVLQSKKNDISSKSNNKDNNMDITREEEKYLKNYIIPYKENEAVIEINYEQTDRLCHTEEEADVSIVNTNENIHTLYNIKEEYSDSKSDI